MRKRVGKRFVPRVEVAQIRLLLEQCFGMVFPALRNTVKIHSSCNKCGNGAEIVFTEDLFTGDIFVEGPDFCSRCKNRLTTEGPSDIQLSQEGIAQLFGS